MKQLFLQTVTTHAGSQRGKFPDEYLTEPDGRSTTGEAYPHVVIMNFTRERPLSLYHLHIRFNSTVLENTLKDCSGIPDKFRAFRMKQSTQACPFILFRVAEIVSGKIGAVHETMPEHSLLLIG